MRDARSNVGSTMIVDVHCHMFNADDLPIAGFVSHHEKLDWFGGRGIARLLDRYIQNRATGHLDDVTRMRQLLDSDGFESAEISDPTAELAQAEDVIRAELGADPELAVEIERDLAARDAEPGEHEPAEGGAETFSIGDGIKRVAKWAALFSQSRLALPALYDASTGSEVRLAVPMLVDLDAGVGDRSETSRAEQIELFDLLSRISMRGLLPGAPNLVLHPFVAFDPLRELAHRTSAAEQSPLDLVKDAIKSKGFIGVKVYPPMGWRPSGNDDRLDISLSDGRLLDEIVLELATWCAANDVPVTAHGNASNETQPAYREFGSPARWAVVLRNCPNLRLNLGHFGGAHSDREAYTWTVQIAEMMDIFVYLFADVSCHRVDEPKVLAQQMAVLRELHEAGRNVLARVQFGTDWYMEALNPDPDAFLGTYRLAWQQTFGDDAAEAFLGGNALRFLGLSEPTDNRTRLRQRYDDLDVPIPEWLT